MREKKYRQTGKESLSSRHPIRQQLMAAFLGLCLIVVSIPVLQPEFSVQAAELQDHMVTLDDGEYQEREEDGIGGREDIPKERMLEAEAEERILFAEGEELSETPTTPGCGVVSEDVTWTESGILANGELVVMPGVTLTINSTITITGTVTIKGGGTIARGSTQGGFSMASGSNLTVEDVTMDGRGDTIQASVSMITLNGGGNLVLESGCTIRNCRSNLNNGGAVNATAGIVKLNDVIIENCSTNRAGGGIAMGEGRLIINGGVIENCTTIKNGGGIVVYSDGELTLNDATIRNCSAGRDGGGGLYVIRASATINGGCYENNSAGGKGEDPTGFVGGGFIYMCTGTLIINDGRFIGNSSETKGGCIYHCGHNGTHTIIRGGVFLGNTCSNETYKGSGALHNSTADVGTTSVTLSGDVKFGDGADTSGTDGIYLDVKDLTERKVQISDTLTYPIKLYMKPREGYVMAQGVNQYQLLRERDMKKITFVDVTDSGKTWYAVLNDNNQIYTSETNPDYGNFVYYIKNGAKGTAPTDDTQYALNADVTVQSADGLSYEGRQFAGWNTQEDGEGTTYWPGNTFKIQGDTDLYAIFKAPITASFYSGSAGNKNTVAAVMDWDELNGTLTVPEPEPMAGYEAVGWSSSPDGFEAEAEIAPGEEITLTKDAVYYGVYRKEVTLTYDANGGDTCPADETRILRANVNETQVCYDIPAVTVTGETAKRGAVFLGWSTQADGSDVEYEKDDTIQLEDDTTLYAVFEDKRVFIADFYSGSAGNKVTRMAELAEGAFSGTITVPQPEPMAGYEAVGWTNSLDGFEADAKIAPGEEITLTQDAVYYGVYRKEIALTYDANGGDVSAPGETGILRANVNEDEVSYDSPAFTTAGPLPRTGYVFAGWNTADDGKGEPYLAGETMRADRDTTLYAMWIAGNYTPYRIEHFRQDLEGDSYSRVEMDTEYMAGKTGDLVEAEANPYTGFALSSDPELGKTAGVVEADGSLVLQLYYDRDIYEIDFDLNGGEGEAPGKQKVRYGGLLQEPQQPQRKGYTFAGWYKDKEGTETAYWDLYQTVEENTESINTTLYAKWVDETAPVLGEASFRVGQRNLMDWVAGQKKLVITVPVTEEGSGLSQGIYTLIPEKGEKKKGTAKIRTEYTLSPGVQARSGGMTAVMTVRGNAQDGEYEVEITVEEEFKGSIALSCTDQAGNTSVEKMLTADGAGAVVEDNAPEIHFSKAQTEPSKERAKVNVEVRDSAGKNVTAGIAEISYRIDKGKAKAEGKEELAEALVEKYNFEVEIQGEGKHTLSVTAVDYAGNKSTKEAVVKISKEKAVITLKPANPVQQTPKSAPGEPATGESTHVKIFATLGMIAGFTYLLLYFASGENGITEDEKEEIISRLVRWAQKAKWRKYPALIVIMLFLAYYHSVGKSVSSEWRKVCEG